MKSSRYNFFFKSSQGKTVLFNALTRSTLLLTPAEYECAKQWLQAANGAPLQEPDDHSQETRQLVQRLWQAGCFIADELDECALLKAAERQARFRTDELLLLIMPTLSCNCACQYCYVTPHNQHMEQAAQQCLLQFIEQRAATLQRLYIRWFGGEPLLRLPQIEELSQALMTICQRQNVELIFGMATNGLLLTPSVYQHLSRELKIRFFEVTLDGPPEVHDKRRPQKNGRGSYTTILHNLLQLPAASGVALRINIDLETIGQIPAFLATLKAQGLMSKVQLYITPVEIIGPGKQGPADKLFADPSLYAEYAQLLAHAGEIGFRLASHPRIRCGAVCANQYIVDPRLNLYKCVFEIGQEDKIIGCINSQAKILYRPRAFTWYAWDPFSHEQCRTCRYLPICMGGCPLKYRTIPGAAPTGPRYATGKIFSCFLPLIWQHQTAAPPLAPNSQDDSMPGMIDLERIAPELKGGDLGYCCSAARCNQ